MAYPGNYYQDQHNTVCLNYVTVLHTQVINVIYSQILLYFVKIVYILYFYIIPYISRKLYNNFINIDIIAIREKYITKLFQILISKLIKFKLKLVNNRSLGRLIKNFIFTVAYRGSSKTRCVNTYSEIHNDEKGGHEGTIPEKENDFIYWLAGLIDGDGSLLVNKNKVLSCEITIHERDVKALFEIKDKYHGSVLKRSKVKAYRWRVYKKVFVEKLYKDLNSKLITDGKKIQLIKMGKILNIEPVIIDNYDFKLDSAWLSGFIDADGCFTIRNAYTLTISIAQKTSGILYSIQNKLNCGNIYYDKKGDTYNYVITDIQGIKIMLEYLSRYPLKTSKRFDFIKFCKLVEYKELKYHYKNNLNKSKIDNLVKLFRNRYKT